MASWHVRARFRAFCLCPPNSVSRKPRLWFEGTPFDARLFGRRAAHLVQDRPRRTSGQGTAEGPRVRETVERWVTRALPPGGSSGGPLYHAAEIARLDYRP